MTNRKRSAALLICIGLVLALSVSAAFVAHEAGHHDCCGEDCPVCRTIAITKGLLRAFRLLLLSLLTLLAPAACLCTLLRQTGVSVHASGTLVSWKIRLND